MFRRLFRIPLLVAVIVACAVALVRGVPIGGVPGVCALAALLAGAGAPVRSSGRAPMSNAAFATLAAGLVGTVLCAAWGAAGGDVADAIALAAVVPLMVWISWPELDRPRREIVIAALVAASAVATAVAAHLWWVAAGLAVFAGFAGAVLAERRQTRRA